MEELFKILLKYPLPTDGHFGKFEITTKHKIYVLPFGGKEMTKKAIEGFDVLTDLAIQFVERQKGVWDHAAWLNFLSDVQKKGFELSDDMKTYLGSLLESMKKVYEVTSSTKGIEDVISDITEDAVKFIKKTRGVWVIDWEMFVNGIQKKGMDITEETVSYLCGILDSMNKLYAISPFTIKKEKKGTSKK